jgi:hypothetical protein
MRLDSLHKHAIMAKVLREREEKRERKDREREREKEREREVIC